MPIRNNRFYTGVSLEPEVANYLDDLCARMKMNRSWVISTIIYEYANLIENKKLMPVRSIEAVIRKGNI
jgi:metal-responsive CopG/Arc/MetJ family transcriptional regulator